MTREEATALEAKIKELAERYPEVSFAKLSRIAKAAYDFGKQVMPEPQGLDEAAEEYARTTFTQPYSETPEKEITIIEPDKLAGFKAGAKWMAEQGVTCEVEVLKDFGISFLKEPFEQAVKEFDGDKVIVQIRKA